ncbi:MULTISPECIES: hypothetical protein [unclassified Marinobacter]|jgi:nucleoside-diphosphate-sugar epimerase|uniref:hypothetical protein n=1 Tax=unclassified Marinobacter TaxID=83889 RepID=UPI0003B86B7F|nr:MULTISPECIES: hypothetical protein [unclassified Marinobacter]ERS09830.1 hypothetical protein Q673_16060 [Marinobacter sp. EN3]
MEGLWRLLRISQRPPLTREAFNLVGSRHRISMEKVHRELGYRPRVSYEQAMQQLREQIIGSGFVRYQQT